MATCPTCGKSGFGIFEIKRNMCPSCLRKENEKPEEEKQADRIRMQQVKNAAGHIPITTESYVGEAERLGIVASEVVFGMNIFKDFLANIRDIVGGRSGTVQKVLKDARKAAFEEVQLQAADLGADMIVAVDIDYHSISTGSSANMMMVAVSGTAIKKR